MVTAKTKFNPANAPCMDRESDRAPSSAAGFLNQKQLLARLPISHIVQLAHDRENSLCAAGSATTPVSLAVRRSRAVTLPKSSKLKVFQQFKLYANSV
jgi:hypothetical protein